MASPRHPRARRTVVALALTVAVAGVGSVLGAFTATTQNPGNSISTGTVALSDSDGADVAMYTAAAAGLGPGQFVERCLRVTYTGSLPAVVELSGSAGITGATSFQLTVERGTGLTGAFPACTGFTGSSTAFSGGLETFPAVVAGKEGGVGWVTNDTVDYRFVVTAEDDSTPDAHRTPVVTSPHVYTWVARSS